MNNVLYPFNAPGEVCFTLKTCIRIKNIIKATPSANMALYHISIIHNIGIIIYRNNNMIPILLHLSSKSLILPTVKIVKRIN